MRELCAGLVERVLETHRIGQRTDFRLVAGEEMPAGSRLRPAVLVEHPLLFGGRLLRCLRWIEADDHHRELHTSTKGDDFEAAREPAQHLRAEHRAAVVHEREDDRLLTKEIAQMDLAAGLIAK